MYEVPAEQRREPVAVRVAAHLDDARGGVEHLARAEVLKRREARARAVLQVQLERACVQRLARAEVLGEVVLVDAELAVRRADDQRARVLRDAGVRDRVDDLERVLDDDFARHVQERAAAPQRRVGCL